MSADPSPFMSVEGNATVVHGLPEELVAMVFGKFSRSRETLRETLSEMVEGHPHPVASSEAAKSFHKRITIGYGHKSVGDHAMVHFALEDVSMLAERSFTSARLIAATSKSSRFVDFTTAPMASAVPSSLVGVCTQLQSAYTALIPLAERAVLAAFPYDASAWKTRNGYDSAVQKRALDLARDLLPIGVATTFGVTCSATALRELLEKRHTFGMPEITSCAEHVRVAAGRVFPSLLGGATMREVTHHSRVHRVTTRQESHTGTRLDVPISVKAVRLPTPEDFRFASEMTGLRISDLLTNWEHHGHHLPPDRTSELIMFAFDITLPFAIHRDLARHRMATLLESTPHFLNGYGSDPLLTTHIHLDDVRVFATQRQKVLAMVDAFMLDNHHLFAHDERTMAYALPMATMVTERWCMNLRELIHFLGLRTTLQGHPGYRAVAQMMAVHSRSVGFLKRLIDNVVNTSYVIVGRPEN